MTTDLVSDMLTRIRNASLAKHSFTRVQYSKQNLAILKVLASEGFINSFDLEEAENNNHSIKVFLKYKGWWIKKPLFSKNSCRSLCQRNCWMGPVSEKSIF